MDAARPSPLMTQKLMTAAAISSTSSPSSRKKRHLANAMTTATAVSEDEPWSLMSFATNFNAVIATRPPQAPPCLTRPSTMSAAPPASTVAAVTASTSLAVDTDGFGHQQQQQQIGLTAAVKQTTTSGATSGRVKAMVRVCPVDGTKSSFLICDESSKQITLLDQSVCAVPHHAPSTGTPPAASGSTSNSPTSPVTVASRRRPAAPKTFNFDAVFSQDSSMSEICATSLVDIIQAVVNGQDGCVFSYGHARLGKTYTMLGVDDSPQNLGIIPCAISWLYRLIDDRKQTSSTRFSVRVSAIEVTGRQETLTDLLAGISNNECSVGGHCGNATGLHLKDDAVSGIQLENQVELRAPTAQHAGFYLDAAIAARTIPEIEDDARNSHLLFTLNVYQYRVDHDNSGQEEVIGGRSRLHLLDLGSCSSRNKNSSVSSTALSLSALGSVLLALLNGQRHVPHRDSKLTQLLWDTLSGSSSTSAAACCIIAHVSPADHSYNETLQVIQWASRIFRIRIRKKSKLYGTSSDDSSQDGGPVSSNALSTARSPRRIVLQHQATAAAIRARIGHFDSSAAAAAELDYTSSSEQSCDTVIYVGKNGRMLSDRELTDNEGPPKAARASTSATGSKMTATATTKQQKQTLSHHCNGSVSTADATDAKAYAGGVKYDVIGSTPKASVRTRQFTASDAARLLPNTVDKNDSTFPVCEPASGAFDSTIHKQHRLTPAAAANPDRTQLKIVNGCSETKEFLPPNCSTAAAVPPGRDNGTITIVPTSGKIRRKVRRPVITADGADGTAVEQWIDGPNAEPLTSLEQKPTVFISNQSGQTTATVSPAAAISDRKKSDGNGEKWIDGPRDFRTDPSDPTVLNPRGSAGISGPNPARYAVVGRTSKSPATNRPRNDEFDGETLMVEMQLPVGVDETPGAAAASMNLTDMHSGKTTTSKTERSTELASNPRSAAAAAAVDKGSESVVAVVGSPSKHRAGHHGSRHHQHLSSRKTYRAAAAFDDDNAATACLSAQSTPARSGLSVMRPSPGPPSGPIVGSSLPSSPHATPPTPRQASSGPGNRIAQWVRSVQAATFAMPATISPAYGGPLPAAVAAAGRVAQPLVPLTVAIGGRQNPVVTGSMPLQRRKRNSPFRMRSADRAFRDPFGFLFDSFDSESGDSISVSNNSPPPDYASCMAADRRYLSSAYPTQLDINENESAAANTTGNSAQTFVGASPANTNFKNRHNGGFTTSFDWPIGSGDSRRNRVSGCNVWINPQQYPVTSTCECDPPTSTTSDVYDVSTWPRSHNESSMATSGEASESQTESKRLHHPDGASDPKLSSVVEVARPPDIESLKLLSSVGLIQSCSAPDPVISLPPSLSFIAPPYFRPLLDSRSKPTSVDPKSVKSPSQATAAVFAPPTVIHSCVTSPVDRTSVKESMGTYNGFSLNPHQPEPIYSQPMKPKSFTTAAVSNTDSAVNRKNSVSENPVVMVHQSNPDVTPLPLIQQPLSPTTSQLQTSGRASKVSSPKPERSHRTSAGVSLLSCISPRRRTASRALAGLFNRHHSSKDRDGNISSVNDRLTSPSAAQPEVDNSDETSLSAKAEKDESVERRSAASCSHDSDRGSSVSDGTPPLPAANVSGEMVPDCQLGAMDASSDYGSGPVDGDHTNSTTVFDEFVASTSSNAICEEGRATFAETASVENAIGTSSVESHDLMTSCANVDSTVLHQTWCSNGSVKDLSSTFKRRERIVELLTRQEKLKTDLASAKNTLMVSPCSWSFDLHVAEQLNRDDPGYLEALERETAILEKRVVACKSRIMMVTVFDVTNPAASTAHQDSTLGCQRKRSIPSSNDRTNERTAEPLI